MLLRSMNSTHFSSTRVPAGTMISSLPGLARPWRSHDRGRAHRAVRPRRRLRCAESSADRVRYRNRPRSPPGPGPRRPGDGSGNRSSRSSVRYPPDPYGTVGGDEVLQYVQAFAEVRGDRRFDDRAVRLGHQTAHTGQLTDLGALPRAPESAIMYMELKDSCSTVLPSRSTPAPSTGWPSSPWTLRRWPWTRGRSPCCTSRPG
jgi:hypothetical protein